MSKWYQILKELHSLSAPRKLNALHRRRTRRAHRDLETGLRLQPLRVQHQDPTLRIARVNALAAPIERRHNVQVAVGVQRQALMRAAHLDDHRRIAHRRRQKAQIVARIELHLQNGRRKAVLVLAVAGQQIPDADIVVGGRGQQLVAVARPADAAHRMHVGGDDLGNAAREKVPDDDAAVVAADRQQGAVLVVRAGGGQRDAVQRAVELLRIVLAERFCGWFDSQSMRLRMGLQMVPYLAVPGSFYADADFTA